MKNLIHRFANMHSFPLLIRSMRAEDIIWPPERSWTDLILFYSIFKKGNIIMFKKSLALILLTVLVLTSFVIPTYADSVIGEIGTEEMGPIENDRVPLKDSYTEDEIRALTNLNNKINNNVFKNTKISTNAGRQKKNWNWFPKFLREKLIRQLLLKQVLMMVCCINGFANIR